MFTLNELRQRAEAYVNDARASRSEFYDWFEANSFDVYEDPVLLESCVAIDTAFSEFFFDGIDEEALKVELANAVRPFVPLFRYEVARPAREFILSNAPERIGPKPQFGADLRGHRKYRLVHA